MKERLRNYQKENKKEKALINNSFEFERTHTKLITHKVLKQLEHTQAD